MKQPLLLTAGWLLGLLPARPAAAQIFTPGPWVELTTFPSLTSPYVRTAVQSPTANALWTSSYGVSGMGQHSTRVAASADNGLTWQKLALPDALDLWALDAQRAWLLTQDHTTDSKILWQTTTGPTGFAAMPTRLPGTTLFVRFFDAATAVAIATNTIATTG